MGVSHAGVHCIWLITVTSYLTTHWLPISLSKVVYLTNQVKMFQKGQQRNTIPKGQPCVCLNLLRPRPCSLQLVIQTVGHAGAWNQEAGIWEEGGWENRPMCRSCEGAQLHLQNHTWQEWQQATRESVKQWALARSKGKHSVSWPREGTYWKGMLGKDSGILELAWLTDGTSAQAHSASVETHLEQEGKELAEYKSRPCARNPADMEEAAGPWGAEALPTRDKDHSSWEATGNNAGSAPWLG